MRNLPLLATVALLGACTTPPNNAFQLHFPIEDSYVSPQQPAKQPLKPPYLVYGKEPQVLIGKDAAGEVHHAYLKFDLASLPDDPRSIRQSFLWSLDEFRSVPQPWKIRLRAVATPWIESAVRWSL